MDEDQQPNQNQSPPTTPVVDEQKDSLPDQPVQSPVDSTAAPSPAAQNSAGKILIIEDDLPMVKMYSTKLKKENFEVETAQDGEQGLERVKQISPDLVVLDLMIPKIGGMEVLEQLRSDPQTKDLPVIILSNLSQDQDIERSQQLGVKEFLIKANFTPSQVVEKIKQYLLK